MLGAAQLRAADDTVDTYPYALRVAIWWLMWPLDWQELKQRTVRRDRGRCRKCGESVAFVAYAKWPPTHGWGTSNLISLCEDCAPRKVQFQKARVESTVRRDA